MLENKENNLQSNDQIHDAAKQHHNPRNIFTQDGFTRMYVYLQLPSFHKIVFFTVRSLLSLALNMKWARIFACWLLFQN